LFHIPSPARLSTVKASGCAGFGNRRLNKKDPGSKNQTNKKKAKEEVMESKTIVACNETLIPFRVVI